MKQTSKRSRGLWWPGVAAFVVVLQLCGPALASGECSSSTSTVTGAGDAAYGPDSVDVTLAGGSPIEIELTIAKSLLEVPEDADVYFLLDASLNMFDNIQALKTGGYTPLQGLMDAMLAVNPDTRFGVGAFINKPLGGIGWPDNHVFTPVHSVSANTASVQSAVDGILNIISSKTEAIPYRSSLEAIFQVGARSTSLGFRTGSRRIIVVMSNSPYNVEGDVMVHLMNPDPLTHYNGVAFAGTYPPNDLDATLEDGCDLSGQICRCGVTRASIYDPTPICKSCGLFSFELRETGTLADLPAGACEDYPSLATVHAAMGATYEVWLNVTNAAVADDADAIAPWQTLLAGFKDSAGAIYEEASQLDTYPPKLALPAPSPTVGGSLSVPYTTMITEGTSDYVVKVTLNPAIGATYTGTHTLTVGGQTTAFTLDTCTPPGPSAPPTPSDAANHMPVFADPGPLSASDGVPLMVRLSDYVTDADDDDLTFTLVDMTTMDPPYDAPAHKGVATLMNAATGEVQFTPDTGGARRLTIEGSFSFTVDDGDLPQGPFIIIINIELIITNQTLTLSGSQSASPERTDSQSASHSPERTESQSTSQSPSISGSQSMSPERTASQSASSSPNVTETPVAFGGGSGECDDCVLEFVGNCANAAIFVDTVVNTPCNFFEVEAFDLPAVMLPTTSGAGNAGNFMQADFTDAGECFSQTRNIEILIARGVINDTFTGTVEIAITLVAGPVFDGLLPAPDVAGRTLSRQVAKQMVVTTGGDMTDLFFARFGKAAVTKARLDDEPAWLHIWVWEDGVATSNYIIAEVDTGFCSTEAKFLDLDFIKFGKNNSKGLRDMRIALATTWAVIMALLCAGFLSSLFMQRDPESTVSVATGAPAGAEYEEHNYTVSHEKFQ